MSSPISGARCVVCRKALQQGQLTHYPSSTPVNERWTCSVACQNKVRQKAEALKRRKELLEEMDMEDPQAALGLKSEAQRAREGLSDQPPKIPEPRELQSEEDLWFEHSDADQLLAASIDLLRAAQKVDIADRLPFIGLAAGMLDVVGTTIKHINEDADK